MGMAVQIDDNMTALGGDKFGYFGVSQMPSFRKWSDVFIKPCCIGLLLARP